MTEASICIVMTPFRLSLIKCPSNEQVERVMSLLVILLSCGFEMETEGLSH
jgi:hypothetical protein